MIDKGMAPVSPAELQSSDSRLVRAPMSPGISHPKLLLCIASTSRLVHPAREGMGPRRLLQDRRRVLREHTDGSAAASQANGNGGPYVRLLRQLMLPGRGPVRALPSKHSTLQRGTQQAACSTGRARNWFTMQYLSRLRFPRLSGRLPTRRLHDKLSSLQSTTSEVPGETVAEARALASHSRDLPVVVCGHTEPRLWWLRLQPSVLPLRAPRRCEQVSERVGRH